MNVALSQLVENESAAKYFAAPIVHKEPGWTFATAMQQHVELQSNPKLSDSDLELKVRAFAA